MKKFSSALPLALAVLVALCLTACTAPAGESVGTPIEPSVPPEETVITYPEDAAALDRTGFGTCSWGSPWEEVADKLSGVWTYYSTTEIAGISAAVSFEFNQNDVLVGGSYEFGRKDIAQKYDTAKAYASKRYGAPVSETWQSPDGTVLSAVDEVLQSGGTAAVIWQPNQTQTVALNIADNGTMSLSVEEVAEPAKQSGTSDFEHSFWGSSMEQVASDNSGGMWWYLVPFSFAGNDATARFMFDQNGCLNGACYDYGQEEIAAKYETARAFLVTAFGDPQSEDFRSSEGASLPSAGEAIAVSGSAISVWRFEGSGDNTTKIIQLYVDEATDIMYMNFMK